VYYSGFMLDIEFVGSKSSFGEKHLCDTTENFTCYRSESNRDTEADTSLEARREPSLDEETYEEER